MAGESNKILHNKFAKSRLENATKDPENCIIKIKPLKGDLKRTGVRIDYA